MSKRQLKDRLEEIFSDAESKPQPQPEPPAAAADTPGPRETPRPAAAPQPPLGDQPFQALFEGAPDAIWIVNADGVVLAVNPAACRLSGVSSQALIGKPIAELVVPEQQAGAARDFARLVHGEANFLEGYRWSRAGEAVAVEVTSNLVEHAGAPAAVLYVRDITRRQQVKDELRQLQQNFDARLAEQTAELAATNEQLQQTLNERRTIELDIVARNQELDTLNQFSQSLNAVTKQSEILELLYSMVGWVLDNRNLTIALFNEKTRYLSFPVHTVDGQRQPKDGRAFRNGLAEHIIRSQTPLLPGNVADDLKDLGVIEAGRLPKSLLAVPMITGAKVIGAIIAQDNEKELTYTASHLRLMVALASQAAIALVSAWLLADVENRAVQLQTAAAVSHAASSMLNLDELLPVTVELIRNRFNLYYVGVFLLDEPGQYVVLRAGAGTAGRMMMARGHKLAVDSNSMIGWCVANQRARIALDVGEDAVRFDNPALPDTRSELALPLISRGQTLGAVTVQSAQEAAFTEDDVAVLQTMADQVANAITNARLFEQTQAALASLEVRNRYREISARSVMILTEQGSQALIEVLSLLGDVALVSRVFYAEVGQDEQGTYWRHAAEYCPGLPDLSDRMQRLPATDLPFWTKQLQIAGKVHGLVKTFPAPDRKTLEDLGAATVLAVVVPAEGSVPSFIGFSDVNERKWDEEEIAILQTVGATLSNILAREKLLNRLQVSLAETERLYNASQRLSAAVDLQEILAVVAEGLNTPEINRALIVLFTPDAAGTVDEMVVAANWHNGQGELPEPVGAHYTRATVDAIRLLLSPAPIFFNDAQFDERLDPATVASLKRRNIRAMVILPLWTGRPQQLGAVLLMAEQVHHFDESEIRSYSTLVGQLAFAVENRRLFEQTQLALAASRRMAQRQQLINRIASRVRAAVSVDDVLRSAVDELREATHATRAVAQLDLATGGNGHAGNGDER